jgi:hypothetical protein
LKNLSKPTELNPLDTQEILINDKLGVESPIKIKLRKPQPKKITIKTNSKPEVLKTKRPIEDANAKKMPKTTKKIPPSPIAMYEKGKKSYVIFICCFLLQFACA